MLNNFPTAVQSGRYTWRHDSILFTICHYLSCWRDVVIGFMQTYWVTKILLNYSENLRPDIAFLKHDSHVSIELTCCFETNLINSQNYKIDRYCNLEEDCDLNALKSKNCTSKYRHWVSYQKTSEN